MFLTCIKFLGHYLGFMAPQSLWLYSTCADTHPSQMQHSITTVLARRQRSPPQVIVWRTTSSYHRWRIVKRVVGVEQPGTVGSSRLFRGAKIFERFLPCNVQVLIIAIDRIINPEHRYFFQENVFILRKKSRFCGEFQICWENWCFCKYFVFVLP